MNNIQAPRASFPEEAKHSQAGAVRPIFSLLTTTTRLTPESLQEALTVVADAILNSWIFSTSSTELEKLLSLVLPQDSASSSSGFSTQ